MHNTLTIASIRGFHEQAARLDSAALHQSCGDWQRKERRCQLHLLIFLAEVAQRKLFLDLGYNQEENLMILCGQHNRRKFEREMNGS
jgi:hypothetical protein